MLLGQPAAPPSNWERAKSYASTIEEYADAPVNDLAAVISVDAAWLGGLILGLKFLTTGLWMMRQRACPVPRR